MCDLSRLTEKTLRLPANCQAVRTEQEVALIEALCQGTGDCGAIPGDSPRTALFSRVPCRTGHGHVWSQVLPAPSGRRTAIPLGHVTRPILFRREHLGPKPLARPRRWRVAGGRAFSEPAGWPRTIRTQGHGAVLIAAITSCTNTSNPDVMLAAGLLAKKAVEKGLTVKPHVKTSLAPGSQRRDRVPEDGPAWTRSLERIGWDSIRSVMAAPPASATAGRCPNRWLNAVAEARRPGRRRRVL